MADVLAPVSSCTSGPQLVGCAWSYAFTAAVQLCLGLRCVVVVPLHLLVSASSSRNENRGMLIWNMEVGKQTSRIVELGKMNSSSRDSLVIFLFSVVLFVNGEMYCTVV